ncbi:MAG: carbohydrate ABC transporter permease [Candidatus Izemoplasmatales bacterium]|nr:carbohydrate ABC transporter permease [bacterium]MDZ4196137.1 carbohydrate ABC transporter permease [Candidatus Izemoplasmatales bacterium]
MKRLTKEIKRLDVIATLIDVVFIIIAIGLLAHFFTILRLPSSITARPEVFMYDVFGFTIDSGQLNRYIGLLVGYLIIFVPTTFMNLKRVRSKDIIEMDEWTYRTQYLYGAMSFFLSFNPFSAVIRFMNATTILKTVEGYGLKQAFINIKDTLVDFFSGRTFERAKARRLARKQDSASQQDLEKLTKQDFFVKVLVMIANYTLLTFIALFIFLPFYWMILTALKTHVELSTSISPRMVIGLSEMQWVNFKIALDRFNFGTYLLNTLFVGLVSMVGTVITTILAAFAFSRLEYKGKEFIFSVLLMTMMIPGELYTITNYITIRDLNWYDSFYALIFPFMTSVFYIFFLRQTFKQIPDTLYRAAQVDGCGDFKYLTRVMIPIAKPTITTITILSAIGAWDAYIWPQLVTPSEKYWLISVALRSTSFTDGVDARPLYNLQLAATALVTVPLLIVFFSLKKYILAGVGRSGTKG